jgi:uncharacterized protein with HEPN domain
MPPNDVVRLRHMLDAAREAVAFGSGRTPEDLTRDRVLTLALVKCIEIIGEAAAKVSAQTRASTPQIPWSDIIGMRNRLIHAYFDVDVNRVSDTLANDLPPLIALLEKIVAPMDNA